MGRVKADKATRGFLNGLYTEATGLTFPEGAAADLDNVDIELDGTARRRFGLDWEGCSKISAADSSTASIARRAVEVHQWPSPAGDTSKHFAVVRNGARLYIFDATDSPFMCAGAVDGTNALGYLDLTDDFAAPAETYTTAGASSTVVPDNATVLVVRVWGAGGGGGRGNGVGVGAGGGGGGGAVYVLIPLTSADWGQTINFVVGAGGPGRTGSQGDGTAGGNSTVTAAGLSTPLAITAGGGGGGVGTGAGGAGGTATGGSVNDAGDAGTSDAGAGNPTNRGGNSGAVDGIGGQGGGATATLGGGGIGRLATNAGNGADGRVDFIWAGPSYRYSAETVDGATEPAESVESSPLDSAHGFGRLWMTGRGVQPFSIVYDPSDGSFTVEPLGYQETLYPQGHLSYRDLGLMDSGFLNDAEPLAAQANAQHIYNLLNAGWSSTTIDAYYTEHTAYPRVSQQYFLARDAVTSEFDPEFLRKLEFGQGAAPRGRFLVGVLAELRDSQQTHMLTSSGAPASPLAVGTDKDVISGHGFKTCAFANGRLWLAGDSKPRNSNGVYFSQIIQTPAQAGKFYSVQDPTSEEFPDPLDTDGGVIFIPDAGGIEKLIPYERGILVLARKGVWYIHGGQGGFRPTAFSLDKLSGEGTGCVGTTTAAADDDTVVYLSESGVHLISIKPNVGLPVVESLSDSRILTFYRRVAPAAWRNARATFDLVTRNVAWLYLDGDHDHDALRNFYNRALIWDTRTGAFRPYSFHMDDTNGELFGVKCLAQRYEPLPLKRRDELVDSNYEYIVDSSGAFISGTEDVDETYALSLMAAVGYESGANNVVAMCGFHNHRFFDFESLPIGPKDPEAYVVTGDETLNDLQRNKQAKFIHSFFKITETKWESDGGHNYVVGSDGALVVVGDDVVFVEDDPAVVLGNRSACRLQARWDWHQTSAGSKWSTQQGAYRFRKALPTPPVSLADTAFDIGATITYSKLKLRGKGRALALKYSSVPGYDFRLLGYSIPFTAEADSGSDR